MTLTVDIKKRINLPSGVLQLSIRFDVEKGEAGALYGASGAGKTTTLKMIAGLIHPDEGRITAGGEVWFDSSRGICLPPQKRRVGFVFQDYALFPNMTVRQNIAYAAKGGNVDDLLAVTGLSDFADRKPDTLSGGQRQRVALARAMACRPEVMLLDEPLAAIDPATRIRLQGEVASAIRRTNAATVVVSHDVGEVFRLAGRVHFLDEGQIVKSGAPAQMFVQENMSGKFRFTGQVIDVTRTDVVCIVTVLIGTDTVRVVADPSEAESLHRGDMVVVASKAFNPMIVKVSQ